MTTLEDKTVETTGEVTSTDASLKQREASADKASSVLNDDDDQPVTSSSNSDEESQYPTGLKLTLVITSLCLAVFLVALDQTIIAPALGAITAEYSSVKDIVSSLLFMLFFSNAFSR